jgi:glutamyl-tRNA reductase
MAPLDVREHLALPESRARLLDLARTQAGFREACQIVTCNRVEFWGLAPAPVDESTARRLAGALSIDCAALCVLSGEQAYLHAIRVASGLDSAVWGEPQITGQVQAASRSSPDAGASQQIHSALLKIVRAAQGVRKRAGLGPDSRGAPEAATALVERRAGGRGARVLVVGAGSVGRRAAACAARFASVTVADRNLDKARRASASAHGRAVPLAEGLSSLLQFDAAIVALSAPEPLVSDTYVRGAERAPGGAILLVDLSFPRAVAASVRAIPGVSLLDVDDLAEEEARSGAPPSSALAETAAREWAKALHREQRAGRADAVVAQLRSRAEAIRRDELERARRRLSGDPAADAAVLDKLAERLLNRLLHDPTQGLRAAWASEEGDAVERAARQLFRLEGPP